MEDILRGRPAKELLTEALPPQKEGGERRALSVKRLTAYAVRGEKDPEVATAMRDLSAGSRLWGRKLGLFLLEQLDREKRA